MALQPTPSSFQRYDETVSANECEPTITVQIFQSAVEKVVALNEKKRQLLLLGRQLEREHYTTKQQMIHQTCENWEGDVHSLKRVIKVLNAQENPYQDEPLDRGLKGLDENCINSLRGMFELLKELEAMQILRDKVYGIGNTNLESKK